MPHSSLAEVSPRAPGSGVSYLVAPRTYHWIRIALFVPIFTRFTLVKMSSSGVPAYTTAHR